MGVYEIVNITSGEGALTPMVALSLPNVWFEYMRAIRQAESDFEEQTNGR